MWWCLITHLIYIIIILIIFLSLDGDIFIHAKSHSRSKLYELCQLLLKSFPEGSIDKAEDVYGWVYKGGRDLSGFIDGT